MVRRAFAKRGHEAWSVDLLPSEDRSNKHIVGDVRDYLNEGWDLLAVMHPPCTRLCNSGVRWLSEPPGKLNPAHHTEAECEAYTRMDREQRLAFMWDDLRAGARLFSDCWNAPIERVCVENPQMHGHAKALIDNYSDDAVQHVQPHWFGDKVKKLTGLKLRGLPKLQRTHWLTLPEKGSAEDKLWSAVHLAPPGPDRWRDRSRFHPGLADAMGEQWGGEEFCASIGLAA
jgi:hypothetical protein